MEGLGDSFMNATGQELGAKEVGDFLSHLAVDRLLDPDPGALRAALPLRPGPCITACSSSRGPHCSIPQLFGKPATLPGE